MIELIEHLGVPVGVLAQGSFVYANAALCRMCGDVRGRAWTTVFDPADHSTLANAIQAALGGARRRHEVRCNDVVVEVSVSPGTHEGAACVVLSLEDISLRVMLADRLIESEARFQRLVAGTADAIVAVDARGRIVLWNDTAARLFDYAELDVLHESFAMLFPAEVARAYAPALFAARAVPHLGRTVQTIGRRKDGGELPVQVTLASSDYGGTLQYTAIIRDDSERQALIGRLERSEASFRELVERSPDVLFVHGDEEADYRIIFMNRSMLEFLGLDSADELLGKRSTDTFVHPDDRERLVAQRRRRHAGENLPPLDLRWVGRDGEVRDVQAISQPVRFDNRNAWLVIARDITERKRQERARAEAELVLRESEERHRALFDSSPLPAWIIDPVTLRFTAVNDAMVRLVQYSREELLAMTVLDVSVAEEEQDVKHGISTSTDGEVDHVGVRKIRRKDGVLSDLDITSHRVTMHDRPVQLGIGIDVTHALRLEAQLRQTQKMDAIGQLAGGIAHDFNNIIGVILANAEYALDGIGRDHEFAEGLTEIEAAANRAAALTRQLLAFSRKEQRVVKRLSLNGIVSTIERMLSRIVGEHIAISTALAPRLGTIEADTGQIEQIVMNLVVNARDAMPRGGRVVIETADADLGERDAGPLGLRAGRYVTLAVSDTGCGMDEAVRSRVFEPFFTTKAVGKGTGLGLSTVFGIVKQSGGAIAIESEVGRGTTFRIYLPRVDTRVEATEASRRFVAPRGSGTVLVVEDDPQLRAVLRRYLASWGYSVLEAANGIAALEVARRAAHIDVVITDVVMPEMDGATLAKHVRASWPSTRIIFMSGYTEHPTLQAPDLPLDDHFIAKPFTAQGLSEILRRAQ